MIEYSADQYGLLSLTKFKKHLVALFITIVLVSALSGIFVRPKPAQAFPGWMGITTFDLDSKIWDPTWEFIKTTLWNLIRVRAAQFAHDEVLAWVSGEKSASSFITDFEDWMFETADIGASLYLEDFLGEAYTQLCSGINFNLGLDWKADLEKPRVPKCRLSRVLSDIENADSPWDLVSVTFDGASNDFSYAFTVLQEAQRQAAHIGLSNTVKVISGLGAVSQDVDGKIKTPGALITGLVQDSNKQILELTDSQTFADISSAAIGGLIEGLIKRGVNEFKDYQNQ